MIFSNLFLWILSKNHRQCIEQIYRLKIIFHNLFYCLIYKNNFYVNSLSIARNLFVSLEIQNIVFSNLLGACLVYNVEKTSQLAQRNLHFFTTIYSTPTELNQPIKLFSSSTKVSPSFQWNFSCVLSSFIVVVLIVSLSAH